MTRRLLMGLLLLSGCMNSTDHLLYLDKPLSSTPENQTIEILTDAPARPFETIAMVEVTQGLNYDGYNDLRDDLLEEARKLGADAIIALAPGSLISGGVAFVGSQAYGGVGQYKKLTAIAIKYK